MLPSWYFSVGIIAVFGIATLTFYVLYREGENHEKRYILSLQEAKRREIEYLPLLEQDWTDMEKNLEFERVLRTVEAARNDFPG